MNKPSDLVQTGHRCGVVALVGRPNAGKSTLLNAVLGQKIAITSSAAQTTRGRMLGVLTRPDAQVLLYDTPGIHRGQAVFNLAMTERALDVAEDADVRALLFDCAGTWDTPEEAVAELSAPIVLVRTKRDRAEPTPVPNPERFFRTVEVAAARGEGIDAFLDAVCSRLPEGPRLYPEDTLTDAPLRFLAAEQIREVLFEQYRDEIPYAVAVEVDSFKEASDGTRIRANLLVEREGQKAILVGRGGSQLKQLGIESRKRLSLLLDGPVHLNLWVKLDKNWTKRPKRAKELGYL